MSALLHDQQELRAKIVSLSAALRAPASSPLQLAAEIMAFGACAQRASDTDLPIPDEVLLALDDDLRRLALSGIVLVLLGTLQQEGA
ncbi:hypothetical protein [Burkholderia multivorans]|uniref:hypothetical protein n=1 Tax=Burkholderia multivorans TaxID=87883 RepID=UPI000D0082D4|nr:hypothetical protein [Burkholderia multivorans]MCL4628539.1 hypothetical protein [Burkholderia multivorans]MCO1360482.1 hypothetical protein [Burkholderia multivorans]MCO1389965.1 hypothetical protein [Burkholderia multivorans]MCO1420248.1 hypothetical protein [Burkholderia multivorans]MDN7432123.1 hypothetical protein [Burkholderia multivorans]